MRTANNTFNLNIYNLNYIIFFTCFLFLCRYVNVYALFVCQIKMNDFENFIYQVSKITMKMFNIGYLFMESLKIKIRNFIFITFYDCLRIELQVTKIYIFFIFFFISRIRNGIGKSIYFFNY